MKKLFLFITIFSLFWFNSKAQFENGNFKFYELSTLNQNVDSSLKKKIIKTFFSSVSEVADLAVDEEYDLVNMQIGYYDSSEIQAVYIKGINSHSSKRIVVYVKDSLVSDMAMKQEIEIVNGDTIVILKIVLVKLFFLLKQIVTEH